MFRKRVFETHPTVLQAQPSLAQLPDRKWRQKKLQVYTMELWT